VSANLRIPGGSSMGRMRDVVWEDVRSVVEPQINAEGIHLWPFDPGFPMDVRFFRFNRHGAVRPRRHDYFEVLHLHRGLLTAHIHGARTVLKPGELMVMNSAIYHSVSRIAGAPAPLATVLYFMPELVSMHDHDGTSADYLMPFHSMDAQFPHVVPAESNITEEVAHLMRRISGHLPATGRSARLTVLTCLRMILVLLMNHYGSLRRTAGAFALRRDALDRMKPVFALLEQNFAERITVAEAARSVSLSMPRFMALFKVATGSSFVHYLNGFRVAKAQALLESTELPVAAIACEAGFCDQSYFGLVFRRHVQMTPQQYRVRMTQQPAEFHAASAAS